LYHYATTCATLQSTTLESQYSCHEKSGTAFAVHKFTSFFVYQYRPNLNLRSHYTLKYVYIYFTNHIGSMNVFFSLCSTQLKRYTKHQKKPSINRCIHGSSMTIKLCFMSELYKPKQGTRNICARNTYSASKIDGAKMTAFGHFGLNLACSNSIICLLIDQWDWGKRGYSCHLLLTSFLLMLILFFVCHF
jgi:hypothetical protein